MCGTVARSTVPARFVVLLNRESSSSGVYGRAMSGYVLAAGGGDGYDWHGARIVMKARGADTDGQLAVMESTYPSMLTVPAHVHEGEDEMLHVLAGEPADSAVTSIGRPGRGASFSSHETGRTASW